LSGIDEILDTYLGKQSLVISRKIQLVSEKTRSSTSE